MFKYADILKRSNEDEEEVLEALSRMNNKWYDVYPLSSGARKLLVSMSRMSPSDRRAWYLAARKRNKDSWGVDDLPEDTYRYGKNILDVDKIPSIPKSGIPSA